MKVIDEALNELTELFQDGAWIIVKTLLFYILIPEIIMMLIVGLVFRIRGKLFSYIMVLVTLIVGYIFVTYGLPYIAEETTNLANGI